jgi:hypothetical protein
MRVHGRSAQRLGDGCVTLERLAFALETEKGPLVECRGKAASGPFHG